MASLDTIIKKLEIQRSKWVLWFAALTYPLLGYLFMQTYPDYPGVIEARLLFSVLFIGTSLILDKTKYHNYLFSLMLFALLTHMTWVYSASSQPFINYTILLITYFGSGLLATGIRQVWEWYGALLIPQVYFLIINPSSEILIPTPIAFSVFFCAFMIILGGTWERHRFIRELRLLTGENEKLSKELASFQQKKATNALIVTLSHELNNPLTIALGNIRKVKKEQKFEKLTKVEESLLRMKNVVKTMEKFEYHDDHLEPYQSDKKNTQIIDLNNKGD